MKAMSLLVTCSLITSCATTHINPEVESPIPDLQVSCATYDNLELSGYEGVQCTFENRGYDTVRFKLVDISFDDPDASIVNRSEARDILQAWQEKKNREIHNRKVGAVAVMGVGLLAMIFGDSSMANAGLLAASGASTYDTAADISDSLDEKNYGKSGSYAYGDDLLFNRITVPAELAVKRTFLVESDYGLTGIKLCFEDLDSCQKVQL